MASKDTNLKQNYRAKLVYRFFSGVAIGTFLIIIPISYASSTDLNLVQIIIALLVIISSGLLSSIWGEKFLNVVTQLLNSCGF
ncbi:hypothetical protein H6G54_02320 [Anabaena cylindrica FACHB-243]|uniref:Uncharacterized protein n=1 Tax=Anabaena cylindrica (strain ATCC 27899 / PCC 7122) TaxID=272123 RepID=K9ZJ17_ANACC|nr:MULTISPECIES: hypothetical protein [Anabaena]AFZ59213.1 hypothetical protein Anacy_3835 [Anabaena cylindrica PCC 7122]MBD2416563.1 hypothetical protein [Anabaena cylindrica FACHB-243]MBY5280938.1 hypothetical protein [Anabaena sp. CCAP 1446/1C]MBY5311611.1 hypothetical protein [Anabaena sp. CCAP 1446/1C]MCM2407503.1 hypothetical protein [Anabaena sp. CCAP 1446/1C]